MRYVRVIPCLDTYRGVLVKGVGFENIAAIGDPVEYAKTYESEGADEIVVLDIGATPEGRSFLRELVARISAEVSIPVTAGGGIRRLDDALSLVKAGASKVSVSTAAVQNPLLIRELARELGSSSVVLAIDAKMTERGYRVFTHGGKVETNLDPVEWAIRGVELGAGEILLTSIDADGRRAGYDLELIARVSRAVDSPVIASGGAGSLKDFVNAVRAGASAVLAASVFHYRVYTVRDVKKYMRENGIAVRL
ncbi:MAG: imidazole glycerol phosphate synthase cyclase subunit [Acidilobaceae archaeon]